MNILIITQKLDINDSYFGFFHDWLLRFAVNCKKVTVISLETCAYKLPENVKVLSLGKERKNTKLGYLWLFLKFSFLQRKEYDAVFCHMSPIYVISGWFIWKTFNKKIALWYVHRSVDLKLRIAHLLSDIIFTSTPESFRIQSRKVNYMGQAIDVRRFSNPFQDKEKDNSFLKIITVGRITQIKRLDILIEAISIMKSKNIPVRLDIIGAVVLSSDIEYDKRLREMVKNKNLDGDIAFIGSIANKDLPRYYWNSDIFVNLCPTGGLDKAVLEAMASGLPTVVSNKAFREHLNGFTDELLCKEDNAEDCAEKIISLHTNKNLDHIGKALYNEVLKRSDLDNLITLILKGINSLDKAKI